MARPAAWPLAVLEVLALAAFRHDLAHSPTRQALEIPELAYVLRR